MNASPSLLPIPLRAEHVPCKTLHSHPSGENKARLGQSKPQMQQWAHPAFILHAHTNNWLLKTKKADDKLFRCPFVLMGTQLVTSWTAVSQWLLDLHVLQTPVTLIASTPWCIVLFHFVPRTYIQCPANLFMNVSSNKSWFISNPCTKRIYFSHDNSYSMGIKMTM